MCTYFVNSFGRQEGTEKSISVFWSLILLGWWESCKSKKFLGLFCFTATEVHSRQRCLMYPPSETMLCLLCSVCFTGEWSCGPHPLYDISAYSICKISTRKTRCECSPGVLELMWEIEKLVGNQKTVRVSDIWHFYMNPLQWKTSTYMGTGRLNRKCKEVCGAPTPLCIHRIPH